MLSILHKTPHWIALHKPAGMSVEQGPGHYDTVESILREHLPSQDRIGFPHRLDRPTSGLLLMARRAPVLRALNQQFARGQVTKHYLMLTQNDPPAAAQTCTHWLEKSKALRKAILTEQPTTHSKEAKLWYRKLQYHPPCHLLQVRLFTGRYHQIRAQMSAIGCPVRNDHTYGGPVISEKRCIALHSWRLQFTDPVTGEDIHLEAPLPANACWPEAWHGRFLAELT